MPVSLISSNQESGRLSRSQVNQLIDLNRYPIDQLEGGAGRDLIKICQNNLGTQTIALLPGFIRPSAILKNGRRCAGPDRSSAPV